MKPYLDKDYYLVINQLYTNENKWIDHFHHRIIFSLHITSSTFFFKPED